MEKVKLLNKYAEKFLSEKVIADHAERGVQALRTLHAKNGAGNDL